MRYLFITVLLLVAGDAWAQDAKNLKVLPSWTMRACPTEAFATYDLEGARKLRLVDNDCALWKTSQESLQAQLRAQEEMGKKWEQLKLLDEKARAAYDTRINDLLTQLKKEIAEKNEYKYKPSNAWLGWVIGGGAALLAAGVATGLGIAYSR